MLLFCLFFLITYAQDFQPGCIVFCGLSNPACIQKCQSAPVLAPKNEESPLVLELITTLPTNSEITGSDMFSMRDDGLVYFTTREGDIWRFIPKPTEGNQILTKIYSLPESFRLDTSADKGLYDIAFLRNFPQSHAFYLVFAARPPPSTDHDHCLIVAEFLFTGNEEVEFTKIVEELPQTVPYRSGGFLKGASDASQSGHLPLWISTGGNQEHNVTLLELQPKYSSIYGIFPDKAVRMRRSQAGIPPPYAHWANGLANPYECDYAPLGFPNSIVCLTRHYNENNEFTEVALFRAEQGHTFNEDTASIMDTTGYTSIQKSHSYTDIFDATKICVPDSVIFSGSNLLGNNYANRVMLATPTCEEENFPPSTMRVLVRDFEQKKFVLVEMPVDFEGKRLWGMQLIGAERTFGLFLGGRDLFTGDYQIYWIRKRKQE